MIHSSKDSILGLCWMLVVFVELLFASATLSLAQEQKARPSSSAPRSSADQMVTTRQQTKVGPRVLKYTSTAGTLPIRNNDTGEIHGNMFFASYSLDRGPGEPKRPLMFLWNGGPGANATLVHLSGFGPKRVKSNDDPTGPSDCECELEDNETTWLDLADLVFVDPIGTGFSRPTRAEYGSEFYSTLGDIASVAEFVRVFLTRFDAWDAPVFLTGESYGTWRAAGVAEALEQRNIKIAGVILISGGVAAGNVASDDMRAALFVPTRAATAFYHKRLSPDLQSDLSATLKKAESWALNEYAPALAKRDKLSDAERQGILAQLSRFTGIDPPSIDAKTLILPRQLFAEQLLRDRNQTLGRFDTRLNATAESRSRPARNLVILKYLRTTVGFQTDLPYQLVATGLYDSLNSCPLNEYVINRLEPGVKRNITAKCYEGGHMMYESRGARQQLKQDVRKFLEETLATGRQG